MSLFAEILQDLKQGHLKSAGALFQFLYYTSYRMVQEGTDKKANLLLNSALLYMRENIHSFSVSEMCHYLNVEERTVRNLFMRGLNTSPKKYFEYLRLEESKRYLETTSIPVSAIAAQLGFSNPGHFSTAFRKEYGSTPKQYRMVFNTSVSPDS